MSTVAVDIPNINKSMTKPAQAKALFAEELSMVSIGKNKAMHTVKQINDAFKALIRYFPDLKKELQREKVNMTTANLQKAKLAMTQHLKNSEMKVLEYADMCRDAGDEVEYKVAAALYKRLQSVSLK